MRVTSALGPKRKVIWSCKKLSDPRRFCPDGASTGERFLLILSPRDRRTGAPSVPSAALAHRPAGAGRHHFIPSRSFNAALSSIASANSRFSWVFVRRTEIEAVSRWLGPRGFARGIRRSTRDLRIQNLQPAGDRRSVSGHLVLEFLLQ